MSSERGEMLESSVRATIAKQLTVAMDRVLPDAHLVDDLRADIIALTQLALALELEFGIEIVDAEWIEVEYVGQAVAYVRACCERSAARRTHGTS